MKAQFISTFLIGLVLFNFSLSSPIEKKYPKPQSISDLESNPREFLKRQRDRERYQDSLYSQTVSEDFFRILSEHRSDIYKIKAKAFSKVNKNGRGKTLYYYKDFKKKKIYLKLRNVDVTDLNVVILNRKYFRNSRNKNIKIKQYYENIKIKQRGVVKNYRYRNRIKTESFVRKNLKHLTIRRSPKYYQKKYEMNTYKFEKLPPKYNKIIIYNRNQDIDIRYSK